MQKLSASFSPYRPACWLRVAGPDAYNFIQGQFTNDVKTAGEGQGVYGLWLSQKGKMLADGFVLRVGPEEFRVFSYFSEAGVVRQRLEDYLVADEVVIEDLTADWAGVSVLGAEAGSWLQALSPRQGVVFAGRRTRGENWEWLFPAAAAEEVHAHFAGCRSLDATELERLRISASIPAVPRDAGPGELPIEAGLDDDAISSTKGCYLGQEIIARLKSRGSARRGLFRIRGEGPVPPLPAALTADGRPAGELRSVAPGPDGTGYTGLALLVLRDLAKDRPLALPSGSSVEIG
jgi:hypothetical protein